jgi:hypothetical protein
MRIAPVAFEERPPWGLPAISGNVNFLYKWPETSFRKGNHASQKLQNQLGQGDYMSHLLQIV